jgi:hypothetical protein
VFLTTGGNTVRPNVASLSFAFEEPVDGGDWLGCARALLDHGMPGATIIPLASITRAIGNSGPTPAMGSVIRS